MNEKWKIVLNPFIIGKYVFFRYISRHVCGKNARIIIYGHGILNFSKNSILEVNQTLFLNRFWVPKSKAETIIQIGKNAKMIVDGSFSIWYGGNILVFDNATLQIGSGYCNINCLIRCKERICIGHGVMIAHNVTIMDSDFHEINRAGYIMTRPVVIEDHVWIGKGATILKGVTIGTGSIIAAESVVTHNVPAHSLVAGNPAKIIKSDISWK